MSAHVDPKAPADSPLHPANATHDRRHDRAVEDLRLRESDAAAAEEAEYARLLSLYGPAHTALLIDYGTPEERAEGAEPVPSLVLLERQEAADSSVPRGGAVEFPVQLDSQPPVVEVALKRPPKDAPRGKWVDYAKVLDPDLTDADLKPITVAGLREMTAYQDGTAEPDA